MCVWPDGPTGFAPCIIYKMFSYPDPLVTLIKSFSSWFMPLSTLQHSNELLSPFIWVLDELASFSVVLLWLWFGTAAVIALARSDVGTVLDFSSACPKNCVLDLLLHLTSHKALTSNKNTLWLQSFSGVKPHHGFGCLSCVSQFTGLSCPSQTIPFGMPFSTVTSKSLQDGSSLCQLYMVWRLLDFTLVSRCKDRNAKGRENVER